MKKPMLVVAVLAIAPAGQRASNASGRTMHTDPGAAAADALVDPLSRRIPRKENQ